MAGSYYPSSPSSLDLDRSPSLSSNSSGASASSSHSAITPALPPASTFPSLSYNYNHKDNDTLATAESDPFSAPSTNEIRGFGYAGGVGGGNGHRRTTKGSIGSMAALVRSDSTMSSTAQPRQWTPAHRAGSQSVDSTTSTTRTRTLSTSFLNNNTPPSARQPLSTTTNDSPSSTFNNGSSRTPTSTTSNPSAWRSSTTSSPSSRPLPIPPSSSSSQPRPSSPSTTPTRSQTLSVASSIFSSSFAAPSSPLSGAASPINTTDLSGSVVGSVRGASFATGGGRGTHKRAMTLPMLGLGGLPVPGGAGEEEAQVEEVVGLTGRLRLSRPISSSSPFAPSAVFSSSHGLNRVAGGSSAPSSPSRLGSGLGGGATVKAIDRQRQDLVAYEYLCHVAETKEWLTIHISPGPAASLREIVSIGEFEQSLRSGYALAHLARSLGGPECQGGIYNDPQLQWKHTGNIAIFFDFLKSVNLPEIFRFETVDLYNAKNLPKVIYCVHALSHLLARLGMTLRMENLVGQIEFTDAEVNATQRDLNNAGVRMPNFGGIGKALARQIKEEPDEEEMEARRVAEEESRRLLAEEQERRKLEEEVELERQRQLEQERLHQLQLRQAEALRLRQLREAEELRRFQLLEAEEARLAHEEAVKQASLILVGFQAHSRGALTRRRFFSKVEEIDTNEEAIVGLQACVRGVLARRRYDYLLDRVGASVVEVVGLQSVIRGALARTKLLDKIRLIRSADAVMESIQAQIRGVLAREKFREQQRQLRKVEVVRAFGGLQSLARAALSKRKVEVKRKEMKFVEPDVIGLQSQVRGYLARERYYDWYQRVHNSLEEIVELQSLWRGVLARRKFDKLRLCLKKSVGNFVGFQAVIRGRRQGSQYRQLKMGTSVPVSTIKNFVRLLDDSEFDYRGELEVEGLRKELVKTIRETQSLEDDVKDLDTKISLLVKNKITHEAAGRGRGGVLGGGMGANVRGSLLSEANDPFGEHQLDRQSQKKLGLYQELFGVLQTQPKYLARLLSSTNKSGMTEKVMRAVESTTFMVFGYAQNQREEYLLLKLFKRSIEEELNTLPDLASFTRVNFPFVRLLLQYGRGASQRKYLTETLAQEVKKIVSNQSLDLNCDPMALYRADVALEETRTGVTSRRPLDIGYEDAVNDPATKKMLIAHLMALRSTTDELLRRIFQTHSRIPFGIRYVGRELYRALKAKFPQESEEDVLRVVSHLIYYRFIQPALVAPETYDIIQGVVPPLQRKNLGDAAKMLNQISTGRLFSTDRPYMVPMNKYITERAADFGRWVRDVINVEDAEAYFRADEYYDAAAARAPVIYISPNNIYATHNLIASNLDDLAPEKDDMLRKIVTELGQAPTSNTVELTRAREDEISLTLTIRIRTQDDPEAATKALFNQAKRRVLSILKVHHGSDLEAVLAQVVTTEDEDAWVRIVEEEEEMERRQAQQQRRKVIPLSDDIRSLSFHQLKQAALQDILQLRKAGVVDRADKYQSILNAIASDIRSKNHRRVQRQQELQTMRSTLSTLHDKRRYLDEQKQSYHNYIKESMSAITKKGGKRRLVLPWSMQGAHQRQLEKQGKSYQFGSYKYSAQDLYERGILLSIDQYSPKQFNTISLTISSDDIGVYEVSAAVLGVTVTKVELELEELLEMRHVGKQTVLIGNIAKVNLNLLMHLLNRKFTK